MTTPTLMRATSGLVQPHLVHGGRAAGVPLFGRRSRSVSSLPSLQSIRLPGRERRHPAARLQRSQSEAGAGMEEHAHELMVLEGKCASPGLPSGVGVTVPDDVESAGGHGAGRGRRGGGRGGGKDGREGTGAGGEGRSEIGAYYEEMLEADPGNPLLLRNYGKFLHEVEGDVERAEECYGRAILASPRDGEVLSLYGKLIWDAHRDEGRAEGYFERAVEASPNDCYVLGSYAHFLWDAEEEDNAESSSSSAAATSPSSQQPQHLVKAY